MLYCHIVLAQVQSSPPLAPYSPPIDLSLMPSVNEFHVQRFGLQEGMQNQGITALAQDKRGFLWVGTENGILRYDGKKFIQYTYSADDTLTLSTPAIVYILPDSLGNVWVANTLGLCYLNAVTGKVERLVCDELSQARLELSRAKISASSLSVISSMTDDDYGNIWLGTARGIARFTKTTKQWEWFYPTPQNGFFDRSTAFHITAITVAPDSMIWAAGMVKKEGSFTQEHLIRIHPKTGSMTLFPLPHTISNLQIRSITHDGTTPTLWLGTNKGLIEYDIQHARVINQYVTTGAFGAKTGTVIVNTVVCTPTNQLVLGTNDGVYVINRYGKILQHYRSSKTDSKSLSGNEISCILRDRSGVWWFGEYGYGLNKYAPTVQKFKHIYANERESTTLMDNFIRGIHKDRRGYVWLGTQYGGVQRYSPYTQRWESINMNKHPIARFMDKNMWAVYEDHAGVIWTANYDFDIPTKKPYNLFALQGGESLTMRSIEYGNRIQEILCITEDRHHNVWVAGTGMLRISSDRTSYTVYNQETIGTERLHEIQTILFDREDRMWCGSLLSGLFIFDPTTKTIQNMPLLRRTGSSAMTEMVTHIMQSNNGTIWVCTKGFGLFRYRPQTNDFEQFTIRNGLPHNILYGALEDQQGNLWISSDAGIFRFDPTTYQCQTYTLGNGLQSYEFNRTSVFKAHDGTMYFGGVNGLNVFRPENIHLNQSDPNVHILTMHTGNQILHLPAKDTLLFVEYPHTATIQFEYAALEFTAPEQMQYQCLLEGFDQNWRTLTENTTIEFINLNPGMYRFRVRARNGDGVWSAVPTSVSFIIQPPWWRTWWFYVLLGSISIGIVMLIVLRRERLIQRRNQHLEAVVQARTQELRAQAVILEDQNKRLADLNHEKDQFLGITAHDLKNPLSGIRGLAEMLIEDDAMPRESVVYALTTIVASSARMFDLIRNLLDVNAIEQGSVKPLCTSVDANVVLRHVAGDYFMQAKKKSLHLIIHEAPHAMAYTDEKLLIQILDNLISNAIKYSPQQTKITLQTARAGHESIEIIVRDQGLGMSNDDLQRVFGKFQRLSAQPTANESSNGLGLSIVKHLVTALGGTIRVESDGKNQGTTFTVTLPSADSIHQEHI